jgi:ParB-like chromosome segregation protein Spo0J
MPISNLEFHPYSQIFSLMLGDEYQEFADDIKANGLQEPIVLFHKQILDGRNRYRACEKVGIDLDLDNPKHFRTFEGDDEAAKKFVWSSNYVRRHLTIDQKKELAATARRIAAEGRAFSPGIWVG